MPVQIGSSSGTIFGGDRTKLPTGTSDPGTAEAGDMYLNTSTSKVRIYDGSSWSDLN